MSYFSRRAQAMEDMRSTAWDRSYLAEGDMLQWKLEDLKDRLADLEERRPRDPLHPLYDRYFYEDRSAREYDTEDSVQGLLREIRKTESLLRGEMKDLIEETQYLHSLYTEGETPEGQIAIFGVFPAPDREFCIA